MKSNLCTIRLPVTLLMRFLNCSLWWQSTWGKENSYCLPLYNMACWPLKNHIGEYTFQTFPFTESKETNFWGGKKLFNLQAVKHLLKKKLMRSLFISHSQYLFICHRNAFSIKKDVIPPSPPKRKDMNSVFLISSIWPLEDSAIVLSVATEWSGLVLKHHFVTVFHLAMMSKDAIFGDDPCFHPMVLKLRESSWRQLT